MSPNKRILAEDKDMIEGKIRQAKNLLARECPKGGFYSKRSIEVTVFILEEWLEDVEEKLKH